MWNCESDFVLTQSVKKDTTTKGFTLFKTIGLDDEERIQDSWVVRGWSWTSDDDFTIFSNDGMNVYDWRKYDQVQGKCAVYFVQYIIQRKAHQT